MNKTEKLNFRVVAPKRQVLELIAKQRGVRLSDVLRDAVEEVIKSQRVKEIIRIEPEKSYS